MSSNQEQLQPHKRADELDAVKASMVGRVVGDVKLFGHIGADADHGSYAGCKAVVFRRKAHWWSRAVELDEQLNRYFERDARGCLLAKTIPLSNNAVVCLVHRALDEENLEDLSDFQAGYAEFKQRKEEERAKKREEREAEAAKKQKEEQAAVERQMEKLRLIGKAALTHLSNCKKDEGEAGEAKEILRKLRVLEE